MNKYSNNWSHNGCIKKTTCPEPSASHADTSVGELSIQNDPVAVSYAISSFVAEKHQFPG